MFSIQRDNHNPLIQPDQSRPWEANAAFNWSPIEYGGLTHALYRAESKPDLVDGRIVSTIAHAVARDGIHFEKTGQFITPSEVWDQYGCEDPRVTRLDGTYFTFYTALSTYPFGPEGIKTAVAVSRNFRAIDSKHLVTPFNAKAMTLFPQKIKGKYFALLTVHPDKPPSSICLATFNKPEEMWSEEYWNTWYETYPDKALRLQRSDSDHAEIGAAPIKTKHGWLLIYSHIQNYFSDRKIFGIEAVLLDLKDPSKIIGRTDSPIMVPEELYEMYGNMPRIIFPSGAIKKNKELVIYYGATDTTCCRAVVRIDHLVSSILNKKKQKRVVTRASKKPILLPRAKHAWEKSAVFNPAAIDLGGSIHIIYRALAEDYTSTMGYARSEDGVKIVERLDYPIYGPRADFEQKKRDSHGFSGCEDPRITQIGDRLYMLYTAYDQTLPRVAITSISTDDFLKREWKNWTDPILISPDDVDDKDACIFPEQFDGKYFLIHRVKSHICGDFLNSLNFEEEKANRCIQLIGPRAGMWDSMKVGLSSPPVKTKKGWLLFYHGVSDDSIYRMGAILLDLKNPTEVIGRTALPIFEPELKWENEGIVHNVVFPCGVVLRKDTVFLYYGGGDRVVGVATASLKELLKMFNV